MLAVAGLLVLCGVSFGATPATAPTSPRDVFAFDRLHTIELRISPQRWKLLEPGEGSRALRAAADTSAAEGVALRPGSASEAFAYVKADVHFDGRALPDVGVRFKGNLSYTVSASSPRRPMKLDFERFAPGQRFAGLATLNFNNQALDPSQAREALAFELFREMGVPAPRTGFALVYLTVPGLYDREFLGLYTLIEEVDRPFIKRHFENRNGLLLKPQGMRGLASFGDDWKQHESRYRPKGDVDPKLANRVVELAKLVHRADDATFAQQISSYLDVDGFLKYVAVNAALCNFDSFLSTGHNYYLYLSPKGGRATFIPWDMNMSFGGYSWVGTADQIAAVSMLRPYVDHNRLIERVLAIPAHRDASRRHVRNLIEGPFSPERIRRRLADVETCIRQAGEAAASAGKAGSATTRPSAYARLRPPEVLPFVEKRVTSLRAQLDGKSTGFVPAFRDPELVPQEWANVVLPAATLLSSIDSDKDGRLRDDEVSQATQRLLAAAKVAPGGSLDPPAATTAMEALLTADLRKCADAKRWADWLFRLADANRDARLDAAEINAAYRRLLAAADFDYDAMLGGRELIEAMAGTGPP
jgi:hypothetical protein